MNRRISKIVIGLLVLGCLFPDVRAVFASNVNKVSAASQLVGARQELASMTAAKISVDTVRGNQEGKVAINNETGPADCRSAALNSAFNIQDTANAGLLSEPASCFAFSALAIEQVQPMALQVPVGQQVQHVKIVVLNNGEAFVPVSFGRSVPISHDTIIFSGSVLAAEDRTVESPTSLSEHEPERRQPVNFVKVLTLEEMQMLRC